MPFLKMVAWAVIGGLLAAGFAIGLLAAMSTCGVGF